MPNIRIWTLESDIDAKAVKCLANKLVRHLELENLSIQTVGPKAVPRKNKKGASPGDILGWQFRIISGKMTVLFLLSTAMGRCQAINENKNQIH